MALSVHIAQQYHLFMQRKCEQYWGDNVGDDFETPDHKLTITTTYVLPLADCIIRNFTVESVSIPWRGLCNLMYSLFSSPCRLRILMLNYWRWPSITLPPGLIMECPSLPLLSLPSSVEYRRGTTRMMATPCWCTAVLVWVGRAPSSCWIACWREWRLRTQSMCTNSYITWGPKGF